jgi:MFS family permease
VRTESNRHRFSISITLGVFAQWNGVGIVSHYLAPVLRTVGITSVTQQTLISGFLQIWNLIIAVVAALTVDLAGRRRLFLISSSGMLVCYIIISGLAGSFANTAATSTGIAVIPFLFVYYGFYDIAFTPLLYGYTCEIWSVRSSSGSLLNSIACLANKSYSTN